VTPRDQSNAPDRAYHPWRLASQHLGEDEALVWVGRPTPHLIARRYSTPVRVGFGLLVLAAAITVAMSQLSSNESIGIITICVGMFGIWRASTPLQRAYTSRHVVYAVTDRRLFLVNSLLRTRVTSYYPRHIEYVHLKERNAEYGSVVFDQRKVREGAPIRLDDTPLDLGFLETTDARRAERAILDMLKTEPRTRD